MSSLWQKDPNIELYSELELIERLFNYLDYKEESDSGWLFNPVSIGSCRVMMHEPLEQLLAEMKSRITNSSNM